MESEKKQDMISKVLKLLELGSADKNSNANEREVAMKKAAQLMEEYSISFMDLKTGKPSGGGAYVSMSVDTISTRKDHWEAWLAASIAECFESEMVRNPKEHNKWVAVFIGEKHDVELAVFFFKYLRRTVSVQTRKNITPEIALEHGFDIGKMRRSYAIGMTETLEYRMKQLYAIREEIRTAETKALVVVKNQGVLDKLHEVFPRVKTTNRAVTVSKAGRRMGASDGNRINLSRPVSHTGGETQQIN